MPQYVEQRCREMAEAQAEYDRYVRESLKQGQMQQVSQEERSDYAIYISCMSFSGHGHNIIFDVIIIHVVIHIIN